MAKDNFCIYCGFKLFPDDHFCPNCGAKLDDVVKVKKTTAPKDTYSSSNSTNKTATIKQDYTFYKNRVKGGFRESNLARNPPENAGVGSSNPYEQLAYL